MMMMSVLITMMMVILICIISSSSLQFLVSGGVVPTPPPSITYPPNIPFANVATITRNSDNFYTQTVSDGSKYIYTTTQQNPSRISRFLYDPLGVLGTPDLFDFVDTLILSSGEDLITAAALNDDKSSLFVALHSIPIEIIRINVTAGNFSRIDKISLKIGDNDVQFANIRLPGNLWILGCYTNPARLVSINISDDVFDRNAAILLQGDDESLPISITTSISLEEGYSEDKPEDDVIFVCMQLLPAKISRVFASFHSSLTDPLFVKNKTVTLESGENNCASIVYHAKSKILLVSTDGVGAKLVKYRALDLTRLGNSITVDPSSTSGFFAPLFISGTSPPIIAYTLLTDPGTFVRLSLDFVSAPGDLVISVVDASLHGGNLTFDTAPFPRSGIRFEYSDGNQIFQTFFYASYASRGRLAKVNLCPVCATTTTTTQTLPPFESYIKVDGTLAGLSSSIVSAAGDRNKNIFYVGTSSRPALIRRYNVSTSGNITTSFTDNLPVESSFSNRDNAVSMNLDLKDSESEFLYVIFDFPSVDVCRITLSSMLIKNCFSSFPMGTTTLGVSLLVNNFSYILVSSSADRTAATLFAIELTDTNTFVNSGESLDFNSVSNPGKIIAAANHQTNSSISFWCFDSSPASVASVFTIKPDAFSLLSITQQNRITLDSGENQCASMVHHQPQPTATSNLGFLYLGTNQAGAKVIKIQTDAATGELNRLGSITPGTYGLYAGMLAENGDRVIFASAGAPSRFVLVDTASFQLLEKVDFGSSDVFIKSGAAFGSPSSAGGDRFLFATATNFDPQIVEFAKQQPTSSSTTTSTTTQTSTTTTTSSSTTTETSSTTVPSYPFDPFNRISDTNVGFSALSTCVGDSTSWIYGSTLGASFTTRFNVSEFGNIIVDNSASNTINFGYRSARATLLDKNKEFLYVAYQDDFSPICRIHVNNFSAADCNLFSPTPKGFHSATFSNDEKFILGGTFESPGVVHAARIDNPYTMNSDNNNEGQVVSLKLPSGYDSLVASTVHSSDSSLCYFGTQTAPGRIVSIRNEQLWNATTSKYFYNLTLIDRSSLDFGDNVIGHLLHHPSTNILYVANRMSSVADSAIIKCFAPSNGSLIPTGQRLLTGVGSYIEAQLTQDLKYLIAGTLTSPAVFIAVDLENFAVVQSKVFSSGENFIRCSTRFVGDRFFFGSYQGSFLVEWARQNWSLPPSTTGHAATSSSSLNTTTTTNASSSSTSTTSLTTPTTTETSSISTSTSSTTTSTDDNLNTSSTTSSSTTTVTFTFAPQTITTITTTSPNNNNTGFAPPVDIPAPLPEGSARKVGASTTVVATGVAGAAPAAAQTMRALQIIDLVNTELRCRIFLLNDWDLDKMVKEDRAFPDSFLPWLKVHWGNTTIDERFGLASRRGQVLANTLFCPVAVLVVAVIFGYFRKRIFKKNFDGIPLLAVSRCPGIVCAITFALAFPGTLSGSVVLLGVKHEDGTSAALAGDIVLCVIALIINVFVCIVPGILLYRAIMYSRTTQMPIECVNSKIISTAKGAPPPDQQRGIYPEEKFLVNIMFGNQVWTGDQQTIEKYRTLFAKVRGVSVKSEAAMTKFMLYRRRLATSSFFIECTFLMISALLKGCAVILPCESDGVVQPILLVISILAFIFSLLITPSLSPFRRTCDIISNFLLMVASIILVVDRNNGERLIIRLSLAAAFIATGSAFTLLFFRRVIMNIRQENIVPRDKLIGTLVDGGGEKNGSGGGDHVTTAEVNPISAIAMPWLLGGDDGEVAARRYSALDRHNLLGDEGESMRNFHSAGTISQFPEVSKPNNTHFMTGGGLSSMFDDNDDDARFNAMGGGDVLDAMKNSNNNDNNNVLFSQSGFAFDDEEEQQDKSASPMEQQQPPAITLIKRKANKNNKEEASSVQRDRSDVFSTERSAAVFEEL